MGEKWDPQMVISRAPGRFPKSELDTMLVNMLPRASTTQKRSKMIKIMSFEAPRTPREKPVILLTIIFNLHARSITDVSRGMNIYYWFGKIKVQRELVE